MHVLKVLHALTYVATKRIATAESTVESLTFYTYTSSPGKILFTNPRIPPIHQDQHFHQNGLRPDTGENRPAGSHQARRDRTRHSAKISGGQRALLHPPYFRSGSETKTTYLELEHPSTTTHNIAPLRLQEKPNLRKHDQFFAIALPVNSVHKLHLT